MPKYLRSLVAAWLVLLLVASCGGQAEVGTAAESGGDLDRREDFLRYDSLFVEGQDLVASCMRREGFEYFAISETPTGLLPEYVADLSNGISEDEYAERWGFGISTTQLYGSLDQEQVDELQAAERQKEAQSDASKYYTSLSEADQRAYDLSLYGEDGESGCDAEGNRSLRELIDEDDRSFESDGAARLAFASDRRVIEFYSDWSSCMADEGYTYENPMSAFVQIEARYWDADWTDGVVMRGLADEEVGIATASVGCGGPASNLLPVELVPVWGELAK